jgi:hypothetical protein
VEFSTVGAPEIRDRILYLHPNADWSTVELWKSILAREYDCVVGPYEVTLVDDKLYNLQKSPRGVYP